MTFSEVCVGRASNNKNILELAKRLETACLALRQAGLVDLAEELEKVSENDVHEWTQVLRDDQE